MKALLIIASSITICFLGSKHYKQQKNNAEETQEQTQSRIITRNEFDSSAPARTESPPAYQK